MTTQYYTGVIDRFEDDLAVILLEDDGDVVDELVLDRGDLPTDAAQEDAILEVTLEDGEVTDLVYDADRDENRRIEPNHGSIDFLNARLATTTRNN